MNEFEILRNSGVIETILYLYANPNGKRKIDIRNDLTIVPNTAVRSHNILLENELIAGKANSNEHLFILTEKGKEVAKHLIEIEKILNQPKPTTITILKLNNKTYMKNEDGTLTEITIHPGNVLEKKINENTSTFIFK